MSDYFKITAFLSLCRHAELSSAFHAHWKGILKQSRIKVQDECIEIWSVFKGFLINRLLLRLFFTLLVSIALVNSSLASKRSHTHINIGEEPGILKKTLLNNRKVITHERNAPDSCIVPLTELNLEATVPLEQNPYYIGLCSGLNQLPFADEPEILTCIKYPAFSNSHFARLPKEMCIEILRYPDVPKAAYGVCKLFRFLIQQGLQKDGLYKTYFKVVSSSANFRWLRYVKVLELSRINTLNAWGLSEMMNLTILDVSDNNLGKQAVVLQALTNLTSLNVYKNNLKEHVRALQGLTRLTDLNAGINSLAENVVSLQSLTNLISLNVIFNELGPHVSALKRLMKLTSLNLFNNGLGEHVRALQGLTNLTTLNVGWNRLGGNVKALKSLTNLTSLAVVGNQLGKHVAVLKDLTNLTILDLRNNMLKGQVSVLQTLTSLTRLDLRWNKLGENVTVLQPLINRGVHVNY